MKIGIDIDNCISNFDDVLLKEYLKHDKELRNTGIINENPEYLRIGMFDWTDEEEKRFYNDGVHGTQERRVIWDISVIAYMKLTSNEARTILENFRGTMQSDKWIDHCICVGDTAGKIAQALVEKGYDVDIDKTITLGYLHDIGKYNGKSHGHEISGYNYLKDKGYDEEYYNICITHSYLNNDIICTAGGVPNPDNKTFIAEFIKKNKYTIEEKLINLCDLMCPQDSKVFTIDKRLIDIMIRRGAYSNTQYHIKETYKLKEYFDSLLGYNLYDLFPEIKDNL